MSQVQVIGMTINNDCLLQISDDEFLHPNGEKWKIIKTNDGSVGFVRTRPSNNITVEPKITAS